MQIISYKKCFQVNGWNRTELVKDIFDFGYTTSAIGSTASKSWFDL